MSSSSKRTKGSIVETIAEIKNDANFFVVREFISPYLDCFGPCAENEFRYYINKDEFFSIIRMHHPDGNDPISRHSKKNNITPSSIGGGGGSAQTDSEEMRDAENLHDLMVRRHPHSGGVLDSSESYPSPPSPSSTTAAGLLPTAQTTEKQRAFAPAGTPANYNNNRNPPHIKNRGEKIVSDLDYAECHVWMSILAVAAAIERSSFLSPLTAAEAERSRKGRRDGRAQAPVPPQCVSFAVLRRMAVLLVDGVVTDKAQRAALRKIVDQHFSTTNRRIISRNEFIVLLQSNQMRKGMEALRELDFERLAFYLFPDSTMDVFILKKLIHMTHKAPAQHTFVASYSERKMAQVADVIDLLWFLPFLAMYVAVVINSKGLLPRSYIGYDIFKGVERTINAIQFPECYRNDSNVILCDGAGGALIGMTDVANGEQVYGFLRGHTAEVLWPSAGEANVTAAETIVSNALRPVGAIKIRQFRVPGLHDDALPSGFFDLLSSPDGNTSNASASPADSSLRYPPYSPGDVDKGVIDSMAGDSVLAANVLMPWDGSRFGTCEELNSSSSVNGLNKDYSCDGHAIVVPINATREGYIAVIDRAIANSWIDVSTRAVFVEYFLFHQNSGMFYTMCHIFEFQAGGAVTNMVDTSPFNFHDRVSQSIGSDILYFVFVAYLAWLILLMLLKVRTRKITSDQVKWLVLDLMNFMLFIVAIVMRIIWMSHGNASQKSPVWQVEYFPAYDTVAWQFTTFVTIDAFNAILSILAVFRYTKFVPGLDNVVNTLQRSLVYGVTIAFFAFVFLFAFATCACVVYGNMLGYQTIPTAAQSIIVIMWGDFEFKTLHTEQPTFTFFFFAVLNLVLIAILMSSIIAVFTDAFSDEKDSAFDATYMNAILGNNPHHTLEHSTWRTTLLGFAPFQIIVSSIKKFFLRIVCIPVDKYGFDSYDANVAHALQSVLMTSLLEEGEPVVSDRVMATSELLTLIEMHVRAPTWDPPSVRSKSSLLHRTTVQNTATSIYEYAEFIFNNRIDYVLTMTLYVLVPQDRFNQSGVALLAAAVRAQKRWAEKVSTRTVAITDEEQLELRVASVANTEGILGGKDPSGKINQNGLLGRGSKLGGDLSGEDSAEALVASMSLLNRRVFLGILASAADLSHFEGSARLSARLFEAIVSSSVSKGYPYPVTALPPQQLYTILGITDFEERLEVLNQNYKIPAVVINAQSPAGSNAKKNAGNIRSVFDEAELSFSPSSSRNNHGANNQQGNKTYTLVSGFSTAKEAVSDDEWLALPPTVDTYPHTSPNIQAGFAMPLMRDFIPLFQTEFARQCLGFNFSQRSASRFESECLLIASDVHHKYDEEAMEANAVDADSDAIKEVALDRDAFKKAWKRARGSTPSDRQLARIFSIFPSGRVRCSLFLTFCRDNPHAHTGRSFQQELARSMDRYSKFLSWATFYVPFLIIILYFLLIGYNLGEVVHVSESLKSDFAPDRASGGEKYTRLAQVNDWLYSVVNEIWLADDSPARIHNQANFYIGALRVRQHRVHSEAPSWCRKVYNVYFGTIVETANASHSYDLAYPSEMAQSDELKAFYLSRVGRDFSTLVRGECFSAYELGANRARDPISLANGVALSSETQKAFEYRAVDGYSTNSHDTSYAAGGYYLDISFAKNGTEAKQIVLDLRNSGWIAPNTRFLVVEFSTYNYNLQIYTYSQFGFEITDGGVMHSIAKVLSSPQVPLANTTFTIFTVLLFIFVALYVLLVILDIVSRVKLSPSRAFDPLMVSVLRAIWLNPWTLVDFYIIATFVASWAWRLTLIGRVELSSLANNGEYSMELETYCSYCDLVQKIEGTTLFLVFVRFLQVLSFSPRISLLFKTVVTAASDLLSVFVLFVIALLAFAFGYILLFGYFVDEAFNIQNAFFDLFSTSMGGPPSFQTFQPHRRKVAMVFQIAFIITCMFILYNMVVAVLTGALSKVKDSMYDGTEAFEVRDQNEATGIANANVLRAVRKAKQFLSSLVLIREVVQFGKTVSDCFSCCDGTNEGGEGSVGRYNKVSDRCRSQRVLWSNMAQWWSAVDSSTPCEAVAAGLNILRVTQEVRDEKDEAYESHKGEIMVASSSEHYSLRTLNDYRDQVFEMEAFNDCVVHGDYDLLARPLPAFHIYGRQRLPIWDEYLFSKLREEFISVKRHMVLVPSALLLEPEDSLWLQVLEAHHYFASERRKYEVDCDGSALMDMYTMLPDVNTVVIDTLGSDENDVTNDDEGKLNEQGHQRANDSTTGEAVAGVVPSRGGSERPSRSPSLVTGGNGSSTAQSPSPYSQSGKRVVRRLSLANVGTSKKLVFSANFATSGAAVVSNTPPPSRQPQSAEEGDLPAVSEPPPSGGSVSVSPSQAPFTFPQAPQGALWGIELTTDKNDKNTNKTDNVKEEEASNWLEDNTCGRRAVREGLASDRIPMDDLRSASGGQNTRSSLPPPPAPPQSGVADDSTKDLCTPGEVEHDEATMNL